jgi:hypothetical protein
MNTQVEAGHRQSYHTDQAENEFNAHNHAFPLPRARAKLWGADIPGDTLFQDKNECTARYTHDELLGYATR